MRPSRVTVISVPVCTQIGVGGLSGCHVRVMLPLGQPPAGDPLVGPLGVGWAVAGVADGTGAARVGRWWPQPVTLSSATRVHRAVSTADRQHVPLRGRRFRRPSSDARRPHLRQSSPSQRCAGRVGAFAVGAWCARVGVLHRHGPRRCGPGGRHRAGAWGDGVARLDGPSLVRPAVSQPGRAARGRVRQSDRRAIAGPSPPGWADRVPRPGDPGTVRRPVGVPVHNRSAQPGGRAAARPTGQAGDGRQ